MLEKKLNVKILWTCETCIKGFSLKQIPSNSTDNNLCESENPWLRIKICVICVKYQAVSIEKSVKSVESVWKKILIRMAKPFHLSEAPFLIPNS